MLVVGGGVIAIKRSTNESILFKHNLNWYFDRY